MLSYAKFLKKILKSKRRLKDYETVKINEECSIIIQNKLPPKMKDPRNFTIPYTIGKCTFSKILCDLRATINLMPYSVLQKLGLDDHKPTNVSLQLANRSINILKEF